MRLIRQGSFETNSSSTHALVIPHKVRKCNYSLNSSLDNNYCYGREESRLVDYWDEKLAYVYIIIKELFDYKWDESQMEITKDMIKTFKERVNTIYNNVYGEIKYKPYKDLKPNDIFDYIDGKKGMKRDVIILREEYGSPFVDHVGRFADEDMKSLLEKIFNDDDFLKRFIFNKDSYITIGGDEYRGYNIKTIGFEYDYHDAYNNDSKFWKKIEKYKKENDVFFKGN